MHRAELDTLEVPLVPAMKRSIASSDVKPIAADASLIFAFVPIVATSS